MNKKQYQLYLQSNYWKEFTKQARKIFGYKCWFCESGGELHLHHTRYYKTTFYSNRKIENNLRWFLLLCKNCHKRIHKLAKEENLEIYKATKEFRNRFYPNKKMYITKSYIRRNLQGELNENQKKHLTTPIL